MVGALIYFLHRNAKTVLSLTGVGVIVLGFGFVLTAFIRLLSA